MKQPLHGLSTTVPESLYLNRPYTQPMPQRLVERMKTIDRKLDKLMVLVQKKKYVSADAEGLSRLSIQETSPPPPDASSHADEIHEDEDYEDEDNEDEYYDYHDDNTVCLTHIWTELQTIMNAFNVEVTTQPLVPSTERDYEEGTGDAIDIFITTLNIKLSCVLFEADLTLVSKTAKVLDDWYHPWTKTIDYALKNHTITNMEQAGQAIPDFQKSKQIVSGAHSEDIHHDTEGQSRIANLVIYDIIQTMANTLLANKIATFKGPFKEAVHPVMSKDDVINLIMDSFREILDEELKQKLTTLLREMKPDLTDEEADAPETLRDYSLHFPVRQTPRRM
jgi:hypothetical protein